MLPLILRRHGMRSLQDSSPESCNHHPRQPIRSRIEQKISRHILRQRGEQDKTRPGRGIGPDEGAGGAGVAEGGGGTSLAEGRTELEAEAAVGAESGRPTYGLRLAMDLLWWLSYLRTFSNSTIPLNLDGCRARSTDHPCLLTHHGCLVRQLILFQEPEFDRHRERCLIGEQ